MLPCGEVLAQRYWHDEQGRDAFRIDLGKPFLKGDGRSFFTGTVVPSLSMRAAEGVRVEADLPFMRAGFDFAAPVERETHFRLGNPYLGLRIGEDGKRFSGTLGVRLPLSGKADTPIGVEAVNSGVVSNFDEFEAFAANFLTIRTSLETRWVGESKVLLGAKAGPSLLVTTDGDPTKNTDIFFDYGGRIGYEGEGAHFTFGLTGRYLITPADKAFERCDHLGCEIERFHHTASVVAELRWETLRPRATLRIPFDKDIRDMAGAILSLGLSISH